MLRVIQWATGNVGRRGRRRLPGHPDLELVGALVYSDAKAGRDVGEQCGIGPTGVTATTDRDAVVALDADCVLYAPQGEMDRMGALDDICRLLAGGRNVVSTAVTALIYPASAGPPSSSDWRRRAWRAARGSTGPASSPAGRARSCRSPCPDPAPGRRDRRAGADGLQHLRQHRDDVPCHGLRAAARRPGAPGRRRPGRHDLPGAADAAGRRPRRRSSGSPTGGRWPWPRPRSPWPPGPSRRGPCRRSASPTRP